MGHPGFLRRTHSCRVIVCGRSYLHCVREGGVRSHGRGNRRRAAHRFMYVCLIYGAWTLEPVHDHDPHENPSATSLFAVANPATSDARMAWRVQNSMVACA